MPDFNRFINTTGKTKEEIKKEIGELVDSIYEKLSDGSAEISLSGEVGGSSYSAQSIPGPSEAEIGKCSERNSDASDDFGELNEREINQNMNRMFYPHEPLSDNPNAQEQFMTDKIRQMRTLEEVSDTHRIYRACSEITMVRQGEFMADVEDDFERSVFCCLPRPLYGAMSNSQLRTYFTWRTDVRRGIYRQVDEPYPVMYCFELLNKIGVKDSDDAFTRLTEILKNIKFMPDTRARLIQWIKDFYAFNNISLPLPFEDEQQCDMDYRVISEIENGNYSDKMDFLSKYSAYNINESIFVNEQNRDILNKALEYALGALEKHFEKYDVELSSLLCGKFRRDFSWEPFKCAIVDVERQDGFRNVQINARERYTLKRGTPTSERFELSLNSGFIGYILKSVEAKLRRMMSFGRYLVPSVKMMESDFKNRKKIMAAVNDAEFPMVIPDAVEEYCRKSGIMKKIPSRKSALMPWEEPPDTEPVEVTFDESKLDEIRRLADENTRKLIVEEQPQEPFLRYEYSENETDYEELAQDISDEEFNESVADYSQYVIEEDAPELFSEYGNLVDLEPEWQKFAISMTPNNIMFLKNLLIGKEREFCRERDIMPQLMIEEINTAALENLDDVIIEGGTVLEDYAEEVKMIADAFRVKKL